MIETETPEVPRNTCMSSVISSFYSCMKSFQGSFFQTQEKEVAVVKNSAMDESQYPGSNY
ncbi:MAG: hypothetical protein QNK11_02675 [Legionella sp.]|nr:hypothetical protein [Legionella sp.]